MGTFLRVFVICFIAGIWIETVHTQTPEKGDKPKTDSKPEGKNGEAADTKKEDGPKKNEDGPKKNEDGGAAAKKKEDEPKKNEDGPKKNEDGGAADKKKGQNGAGKKDEATGIVKKIGDSLESISSLVEEITDTIKNSKSVPATVKKVINSIVKKLKKLSDEWLGPKSSLPNEILDTIQTIGDKVTSIVEKYS